MVSLTTYIKDEIKVVLFTEIRGEEKVKTHTLKKEHKDSVILKDLKAVYLGLSKIKYPVDLEIYVNHPWVVTALNVWVKQWQQNGWTKSGNKPIKNRELWEKIAAELNKHDYIAKLKEEKA